MKHFFFFLFIFIGLSSITVANAQTNTTEMYQSIVSIPRIDPNTQSTEQYVNALYWLSITTAALLAIIKIIFGGVKYMLSDVVTDKGQGLKDIQGALLGLLIVLSAILILNTINRDLTTFSIFGNAPSLQDGGSESSVDSPANSGGATTGAVRKSFIQGQNQDKQTFIDNCDGSIKEESFPRIVYVTCTPN